MSSRKFTGQNRRAWNEIAMPRRAKAPPPEFFADGKLTLDEDSLAAVGDVRGKRVLNLQCASGGDTLSFASLGAEAVGVDISDVAIGIARDIARSAGIEARFVAADVYNLPDELQQGDFDLVWSSTGIVCWLPDLDAWARTVASALRPGGRLVLEDHHPLIECLRYSDAGIDVVRDYFGRATPSSEADLGKLACGAPSNERHFLFAWPLGDVVTAVAGAGMRIQSLREFPTEQTPYYRAAHSDVRVPQLVLRLPGFYRLVADCEE